MRNDDVTEFIPPYALDILDDDQRLWVEAAIAKTPHLVVDLLEFRAAATAFVYNLSAVAPSPGLKNRLFQRIATKPQPPQDVLTPEHKSEQAFLTTGTHAEKIPWESDTVPGVMTRLLHQDIARREATRLIRCEPGAYYPAHRHGGVEEIFVLEGDLMVEGTTEVYLKGDYIRSEPDSVHALLTRTGCIFFARHSIDNEFVEMSKTAD